MRIFHCVFLILRPVTVPRIFVLCNMPSTVNNWIMKNSSMCLVVLITLATLGANADAQTAPLASPSPDAPASTPVIDPARELNGSKLLAALRAGGFVLYMRHAQQGAYTVECIKSNLSAAGEEQARTVGTAIRDLKIPVGVVRASKFCRAIDTARVLDLGAVDITEDLNPAGLDTKDSPRLKRLSEVPAKGMNIVLVSHGHQTAMIEWAEIIVYRPDGMGAVEPVARIPLARWDELKKVAGAAMQ